MRYTGENLIEIKCRTALAVTCQNVRSMYSLSLTPTNTSTYVSRHIEAHVCMYACMNV